MIFFQLALKSILNRKVSTLLTVLSIAASVTLLLAVERTRRSAEEGFTQSVSQVDLLVGARTGPINLVLYTVFNMGSATNNISWVAYEKLRAHPAVQWTIPYSLGDGHRGFRVVGTDENFYKHYRFQGDRQVEFADGQAPQGLWDVVIGAEVQRRLNYRIGSSVVIAHGVTRSEGIQHHDDKPFRVSGILKPTGTGIDQSLYIQLKGMEAIHLDWKQGVAPTHDTQIPQDSIKEEDLQVEQITAFFLRTKSRIETLRLQREINTFPDEPLLAIIPGATLSELWRGLSQIEVVLRIISWLVLFIGLSSMIAVLLSGLNERRREMAILRSIGASPSQIAGLLVMESFVLTIAGALSGVLVYLGSVWLLRSWLISRFGFYLSGSSLTASEWFYVLVVLGAGVLVGVLPALQARLQSLKDGLSMRL